MAQSTLTLAVDAYNLIKGIYDQAGLTAPTLLAYNGMATPVRLALMALGYDPTATEVADADALNFVYAVIFYVLSPVYSAISISAGSSITLGPIKIESKTFSASVASAYAFWQRMVAGFIDVGSGIVITPREWAWEVDNADQYATEH